VVGGGGGWKLRCHKSEAIVTMTDPVTSTTDAVCLVSGNDTRLHCCTVTFVSKAINCPFMCCLLFT
jgi:hypothetical protein